MSGWLRRLACRWLDLVTAEDLRAALARQDARHLAEILAQAERVASMERRLRDLIAGH